MIIKLFINLSHTFRLNGSLFFFILFYLTFLFEFNLNAQSSLENINSNEVEARLQVRILQLEKLLENLTGEIEESRFELSQIKKETKQVTDDLLYRLSFIEQSTGISASVSSTNNDSDVNQVFMAQPSISSEKDIPLANKRFLPNLSMPLSSPVQIQPNVKDIDLSDEKTFITPENTMGVLLTDENGVPLPNQDEPKELTFKEIDNSFQKKVDTVESAPSVVVSLDKIEDIDESVNQIILPDGDDKYQYDFAFNILRRAEYKKAERALRLFLEQNPNSEFAGNAQYWLGETFYVRGDFERSAVEFLTGYQNYSQSIKGPDNLLKLGLSMARLEKKDGACTALSKLSTEYPSASDTIKRRAQSERGRLGCS